MERSDQQSITDRIIKMFNILIMCSLTCVEIAKQNYRDCMKETIKIQDRDIFEHEMKKCSKKFRKEKSKCNQ